MSQPRGEPIALQEGKKCPTRHKLSVSFLQFLKRTIWMPFSGWSNLLASHLQADDTIAAVTKGYGGSWRMRSLASIDFRGIAAESSSDVSRSFGYCS